MSDIDNNIEMSYPCLILYSGPPGSGKSTCLKYHIYQFFNDKSIKGKWCFVISPTIFNQAYSFINDGNKFKSETYSDELLYSLMSKQEKYINDGKPKNLLLVIDDALGTANFMSNAMTRLITCYRHYKISTLITVQYAFKIPPTVRCCAKYLFIFHSKNKRNLQCLYESYGSLFDSEKEFRDMVMMNTQNYCAVVVDIYNQSFNINDVFKQYKAPPPEALAKYKINMNKNDENQNSDIL